MENQTKSMNAGRRRSSNRPSSLYRRNRIGTSTGKPVHIGYFLDSLLDDNDKVNRENIVKLFNS